MEGIKMVFVLLTIIHCTIFIESANIKCKTGMEHFHNGVCEPCLCPKGEGLNISKNSSSNSVVENGMCSPCSPCPDDMFSGPQTNYLCKKCSTPCDIRKRVTLQHCDGENDVSCGDCMKGYIMSKNTVCYSAAHHGSDVRRELKEEDHTVFFVLTGIVVPLWICCICYCIFRNKIGSWRQKKNGTNHHTCKANLVYIINQNAITIDDPSDPKIDERALLDDPGSR
ncbi:uncharacterized protein LOC125657588 isoform X4 [Ostrea edulis]|uniref:uncharacterized protein LOC125657588 isoform X4 n=1 Tax=Ostrea edulis TaxID=37623 RepID=UPI0020948A02|nr:uncharacterized protein LOC125657588 isoform X4 [Ostrea edulis]